MSKYNQNLLSISVNLFINNKLFDSINLQLITYKNHKNGISVMKRHDTPKESTHKKKKLLVFS